MYLLLMTVASKLIKTLIGVAQLCVPDTPVRPEILLVIAIGIISILQAWIHEGGGGPGAHPLKPV